VYLGDSVAKERLVLLGRNFLADLLNRRYSCVLPQETNSLKSERTPTMIPFDGQFAQNFVLPFAIAAYDSTKPPAGYTTHTDAFDILADANHPAIQAAQAQLRAGQKPPDTGTKMLAGMIKQPDQHKPAESDADVRGLAANPTPNLHFGWFCLDKQNKRVIVAFRGTQFVHDWFDDFDFIPAPYAAVPGRGTVHSGFQLGLHVIASEPAWLGESIRPGLPPGP
jgi:hypothetical protein